MAVDSITKMIVSGFETEVYNMWVAKKGNSLTKTYKIGDGTGEVTCTVISAHVRGNMFQRPRFTWMLNGSRIAKADLLKLL